MNSDRDSFTMPVSCHSEERSNEESLTIKHGLGMWGTLSAVIASATMAKSARYAQSDRITKHNLSAHIETLILQQAHQFPGVGRGLGFHVIVEKENTGAGVFAHGNNPLGDPGRI